MQATRAFCRALTLATVLLLGASSAGAAIYTVTLTNGTSFETRYRPVQSEWSEDQVLIMTDAGNWIALQKNEISDVESQAEISGYGFQLDTKTLFLGWSPNDVVDDEEGEEGEDGEGGKAPPQSGGSADDERPLEYGDESPEDESTFDVFLDVPEAGQALGGGFSLDSGIDN